MSDSKAILSLARSGATSRAWEAFVAAGLDRSDDPAALTLKGRLYKDRARAAAGAERRGYFARAGEAYAAAARLRPNDSYPLINAAAMALFGGDGAAAGAQAAQALALIDDGIDAGETPYWREATRAEALLLLGRESSVRESLSAAIALAPKAYEDRAATLRQFALILDHRGQATDWLDPHRPPPVLHYSGILGIPAGDDAAAAAIRDAVQAIAPEAGYGALAAGSDIIAAEALIASGAELHVVLPCAVDIFRELSVTPFGTEWTARFDALIVEAVAVESCFETSELTRAAIRQADAVAMGLAVEMAALFETQPHSLQIVHAAKRDADDIWRAGGRAFTQLIIAADPGNYPPDPLLDGILHFYRAVDDAGEPAVSAHDSFAEAATESGAIACSLNGADGASEAVALWKAAQAGILIASRNVALAALAAGDCGRVEPLGEMALATGPVPVYALVGNLV